MADQQLVLMKCGEATMYVPLSKVEAYKKEGWEEVSRPAIVPVPPVPAAEPPVVHVEPEFPKAEKPRGRKS
jgi:hypothetical protein